ncbi:MAG: hypothetical protein HFJ42_00935 [Clostridia bacterium]|nr:hypothetical protein [Clostridia bacterium]
MLIEIESYFGDYIIVGKNYTKKEIIEMYRSIINESNSKSQNFVKEFCLKYSFIVLEEAIQQKVDLVIDLDIQEIYEPKYD